MTNTNQKLIELSTNLLNQVSGGCNHKCACEETLEDIKKIPDKISDKISDVTPDLNKVEDRVKKVPEKVNTFFHDL